jgi:predicted transcriptional regulator
MKNVSIPAVRVPEALRAAAEASLRPNETLSAFIEESVQRNIDFRQSQTAFVQRGLASSARAKASGRYISSSAVLRKIANRIARAKKA